MSKITFLTIALSLMGLSFTSAEDFKVGFLAQRPPYTFEGGKTGFAIDLFKACLPSYANKFVPFTFPQPVLYQGLRDSLEAVVQIRPLKEDSEASGYYSQPFTIFENSFWALGGTTIKLTSLADLANYRIIAFPGAIELFGPEFKKVVSANKNYREIASQEIQVAQLYKKEADLVLADEAIFKYFRKNNKQADCSGPFVGLKIKGITDPSPSFVLFKSKAIRDLFNQGLQSIKSNGEFEKILAQYK